MSSFELDIIDEKSRAGSEFMDRVAKELRRALIEEKSTRKITQQAIADKICTSRAVVNREVQGLENLSSRRIGELFWALGWEPYFEARKIPRGDNSYASSRDEKKPVLSATTTKSLTESKSKTSEVQIQRAPDWVKIDSVAVTTQ